MYQSAQKNSGYVTDRYKYYRDTINSLIIKSKRSYIREFFQENNTANKDVWTKINEIIHKRTKRKEGIVISENGTILTNKQKNFK